MARLPLYGVRAIVEDYSKFERQVGSMEKSIQKSGKSVEKMAKETEKGSKRGTKALEGLSQAWTLLQSAAIAGAVVKAGQFAIEMVELSNTIQRAEQALVAYTGSADNAQEVIEEMTGAVRGALDPLTASQNAARLFSMGLASTAEEAAEVTKAAIMLGAAMGRDAQASFEDFTLLLANQSILRLDQFGISSGYVRDRIKELQAETAGLSREQAFMTAVMEDARRKMSALEDAGFETVTSLDKLKTTWQGLKQTIATTIADALEPLLDATADAIDEHHDLESALEVTGAQMVRGGSAARGASNEYFRLADGTTYTREGLVALANEMEQAEEAQQRFTHGTSALFFGLENTTDAATGAGMAIQHQLYPAVIDTADALATIKQRSDAAWGSVNTGVRSNIDSLQEEIAFIQAGGGEIVAAFEATKTAMQQGLITPDEATENLKQLELAALAVDEEIGKISMDEAIAQIQSEYNVGWQEANQLIQNAKNSIDTIPAQIKTEMEVKLNIIVSGQLASLLGQLRQHGGPVQAGNPYIVGEGGLPELFVPSQSGTVVPMAAPSIHNNQRELNISGPMNFNRPMNEAQFDLMMRDWLGG